MSSRRPSNWGSRARRRSQLNEIRFLVPVKKQTSLGVSLGPPGLPQKGQQPLEPTRETGGLPGRRGYKTTESCPRGQSGLAVPVV